MSLCFVCDHHLHTLVNVLTTVFVKQRYHETDVYAWQCLVRDGRGDMTCLALAAIYFQYTSENTYRKWHVRTNYRIERVMRIRYAKCEPEAVMPACEVLR